VDEVKFIFLRLYRNVWISGIKITPKTIRKAGMMLMMPNI